MVEEQVAESEEISVKSDHGVSFRLMTGQHRQSGKTQMALALAQGTSVAKRARAQKVPRATAYRWSHDPSLPIQCAGQPAARAKNRRSGEIKIS